MRVHKARKNMEASNARKKKKARKGRKRGRDVRHLKK